MSYSRFYWVIQSLGKDDFKLPGRLLNRQLFTIEVQALSSDAADKTRSVHTIRTYPCILLPLLGMFIDV